MRIQKWALFARWQVFNFARLAPQPTATAYIAEEQRTRAIVPAGCLCVLCGCRLFEEAKLIAHKL